MFKPSVACIEKITLKVRLVQNKISHGVNGSMNTRTIMMQRVAWFTPTADTHRSFFVKKEKNSIVSLTIFMACRVLGKSQLLLLPSLCHCVSKPASLFLNS